MKHQNELVYGFRASIQWEAMLLLKEMRPQKATQETDGWLKGSLVFLFCLFVFIKYPFVPIELCVKMCVFKLILKTHSSSVCVDIGNKQVSR